MPFQVVDHEGQPLDAHYDLDQGDIVFHARGGTKQNGVNADYSTGLRVMLERLASAKIPIETVWVDSSHVKALPISERTILHPDEAALSAEQVLKLLSTRMKRVGQPANQSATGGNPTKRIRLRLARQPAPEAVMSALRGTRTDSNFRSADRLPASDLAKVQADHIHLAMQRLLSGYTDHAYGPSTDFDLIADDGTRLPPKAVFGLAATEALGFEVLPKHFTGGIGTPCFQILSEAGWTIVPKGEARIRPSIPTTPEDKEWTEGNPRLIQHLEKERGTGISKAKKTAFERQHGRLFCEKCGLDPVVHFGTKHGVASIEVHHAKIQVSEMDKEHTTRLEDLQCLCANCHRVLHRLMKQADDHLPTIWIK